jgi:6-phosphogluconolactonase (cycloisomerase 2 family)
MPNGAAIPTEHQGGAGFIVLAPDGRTAYVVDRNTDTLLAFRVAHDGSLAPLTEPLPLRGTLPIGLALTPDGRRLFVSNLESATISVFAIDADGTPTPIGDPVPTEEASPRGIAVTPDGRFLYVGHGALDSATDILQRFAIGPDGSLTAPETVATTGGSGSGLGITPDGRFLYVTSTVGNRIDAFRIGAEGTLTAAPGSPYPVSQPNPEGIAISPDGRYLFATHAGVIPNTYNAISAFTVGAGGALTPIPGSPFDGGEGPIGIQVTPDGRYLYVSTHTGSQVLGFAIKAGGALQKTPGSPVPSGGQTPAFMSLAIAPNQGPVAALTAKAAPAGRGTRLDARASTDADGNVARYDWTFGDGTMLHNGGPTPRHVYAMPGTYTVHVSVTDNEGCSTLRVFTGQLTTCNGSTVASTAQALTVT